MVKKSFTLFEILISLLVLVIIFSISLKLFTSDDNIETYYKLQSIENQYIKNGVVEESERIKFMKM